MSSGRSFTLSRRKVIVDRWLEVLQAQHDGEISATNRAEFCAAHGVCTRQLDRWLHARRQAVTMAKRARAVSG